MSSTKQTDLTGAVLGSEGADDSIGMPLGLSGTYAVRGLDKFNGDDFDDAGHESPLVLSAEMTPFHIMRRAAAEYRRVNRELNLHIYSEQMTISDDVIHLGMGS